MGQKQDLVPGHRHEHRRSRRPGRGRSRSICTELCGLGHATMRAPVRVLSQADFAAWVKEQQAGGGKGDSGAAVFASAGCGGCHAFTPAGTNGAIGPNLDDVAAAAEKAGEDPAAYVKESIVDPEQGPRGRVRRRRDARELRRVALRRGDRRPRHVSDGSEVSGAKELIG